MTPRAAAIAAACCFTLAGALAPRIESALAAASPVPRTDALTRLAGGAKEAVGDAFFLEADAYFHGGVTGDFEHREGDLEREGEIGDAGHGDRHGERPRDFVAAVHDRLNVHVHYHLEGEMKKEMIPYLALAVALDPHHADAVLATAYWVERYGHRPEEAIGILRKGAADNPSSWEIEYRLAKLLAKHSQDFSGAAGRFDAAIRKSAGAAIPRSYRADMRHGLGDALRALGRKAAAARAYREALAFYAEGEKLPVMNVLRSKIGEIEASATQ